MLLTDNVMLGNNKFCGRYLNPMDGGGADSDATVCCKFFTVNPQDSNLTQPMDTTASGQKCLFAPLRYVA